MLDMSFTNMMDKTFGEYKDCPLFHSLLNFDKIYISYFVEELLKYYNEHSNSPRIDMFVDSGTVAKYNLPFDELTITLYRTGEKAGEYTSNYIFTEYEGNRNLWIDLYYTKEEYNSDDVARDIMREINNYIRDLKEYLNNEL